LNELASIVTDYFGATSLKDVRFDSFHKLLNASDQTARTLSLQAIDSAELFLLFHEFFHVVPSSLRPQLAFGNLTKAFWASPRGKAWTNEMEIDASATSTLLVAASERYSALGGDKPWACLVVFSGADLALHSIEFLDRISHGSITTTDGVSHPACNSHPPAQFRRNSWSHMSQSLALNFARLTEREWSDVRVSVGALMSAREELFNRFFDARGDVVADVRG
jgi:hypothetical protein